MYSKKGDGTDNDASDVDGQSLFNDGTGILANTLPENIVSQVDVLRSWHNKILHQVLRNSSVSLNILLAMAAEGVCSWGGPKILGDLGRYWAQSDGCPQP